MTSMTDQWLDQWLPSRADLDTATARTAAAMADPAVPLGGRQAAAELEAATHHAYLLHPGADAELQAEAEAEAGTR